MKIPIENIYYLLCYAWNKPEQKNNININTDSDLTILDLFAKILIKSTKTLLKRGLEHSYITNKSEVYGLKGKLELSETFRRGILNNKTICSFYEFSNDVIINQVLFTTLNKLLKVKELNHELKKNIKKLLILFPPITPIKLNNDVFKKIKYSRNNKSYEFSINICKIINNNLIPIDSQGNFKFTDFLLDEKKMTKIYEDFIFNFFKIEQNNYLVKREIINWNLSPLKEDMKNYIPQMRTDISLISKDKKIIIDAKYYINTMSEYYGVKKINSNNLYQMFSYLINGENKNNPKTLSSSGILLYPTTSEDYNLIYKFGEHEISLKTINLNSHWKSIHDSILEIIQQN